jgi:glutathione S-transferase
MRLYGSLTSPYVRKVRAVLLAKDILCELVVCDPHDQRGIVPHYNPLGKVPVLELDDGDTLFDSPVIAEYLDTLKTPSLIPDSGEPRWRVLRWQALADGILDAVVLRLLESRRPVERQSPEATALQERKVAQVLAFAEKADKGEAFLVNDRLTLADLAFAVALGYTDFRYAHDWRTSHPQLAAWFGGMSKHAWFIETRPPSG